MQFLETMLNRSILNVAPKGYDPEVGGDPIIPCTCTSPLIAFKTHVDGLEAV